MSSPRPAADALPWEKLSVALVDVLGGMRQIMTVDDLKRAELALGDSYRGRCGLARTRRIRRGGSGLLPHGIGEGLAVHGIARGEERRSRVKELLTRVHSAPTAALVVVR